MCSVKKVTDRSPASKTKSTQIPTILRTAHNRASYQKEVVRMFGLPEGRQRRVEIAAVSGTVSVQGKQFPKQELRGYVHKV